MDNETKQIETIIINTLIIIAAVLFAPFTVLFLLKKNKNFEIYRNDIKRRAIISVILFLPLFFLLIIDLKMNLKSILIAQSLLWCVAASLAILILPIIKLKSESITTKYLASHKNPEKPKKEKLDRGAFFAKSMVTGENLYLENEKRVMHTVVVGSTGSGKTTMLDTLYRYDCESKSPIIIIDPKGNNQTIEKFKKAAVASGLDPLKFKVFSLAKPMESFAYNPLKYGTPIQIKDRLMDSLEWSEPYYKNVSDMFLINLIEVFYYLNEEITIRDIVSSLSNKDLILDMSDKIIKSDMNEQLKNTLKSNISRLKTTSIEDLVGLKSQLNALNPIELGGLLSPKLEQSNVINMIDVINNSEIVYFSLNTLNYGVTAPVIGKLILQDLKSLTSQIHAQAVTVKSPYLSIFIDEFGSFAFNGFIDWQKMCRDVGFAVHLFFQSIADLKKVSPEFKDQVLSNCINKIILRTDDPEECEFWASVAGTKDDIEQSYQVENSSGIFTTKTGMGNQRNTKSMIVEHDVFKQLSIGQAVFIQKSPHKVDLINLYRS